MAGKTNDALDVIETLQSMSESAYVSPVHIAMVYAGLGENDAAIDWLTRAFEVRARAMAWLTVKREFNGLHDDPRYKALVASIGIARQLSD
jgi:hypothetical protein